MAPILRNLLLLSALAIPSLAVPTAEPQSLLINDPQHSLKSIHKTPLQRLRDSIIETIWKVPKKSGCQKTAVKSEHAAPSDFRSKYGRDVVLRFKFSTEVEAKAFSEAANILYLDVWDYSSNWADVRIAKSVLPSFLDLLPASLQNSHTPLMHDLAQSVYDTYPASVNTESWRTRHKSKYRHNQDLFFTDYQPLSVYYPWMKYIASMFSSHTEYFTIGKSAEGRDIPAIRVTAPIAQQVPDDEVRGRQAILVIGGSHPREWISTSTVAYLAYTFATRFGTESSATITRVLKHYDFVFIPILNPDGYEYTWGNDRLWRKNRQSTDLPFCPGIDLDRSFGYRWDGDQEKDNPCSEDYAGHHAFEGIEAKVLADWAQKQTLQDNIVWTTFLNVHSYSQKILYPYSYNCSAEPHNLEDLQELGYGLAKSFRIASGHAYDVTSACQSQIAFLNEKDGKGSKALVEGAKNGGSALDYFYDVLRVEYAYQIQLRDTGTYGFLLPKQYILPSGQETFRAMVGLGSFLLSNKGIETIKDEDVNLDQSAKDESGVDYGMDEWNSQNPAYIFRSPGKAVEAANTDNNDDNEEWERVYDAELRRR